VSRFQLVRSFARNTGLTPHAYLVQRRVLLARRLIAGGTALADAAAASGFADQSHMTRVFVRKYGMAPGAFAISFKTRPPA
jgi:AraC-like DNA-binding protein